MINDIKVEGGRCKPPSLFNYHDYTINLGGKAYKIGALLEMCDEEFSQVYEVYKKEMSSNLPKTLGFLGMLVMINLVENVSLERRIHKLEKND